MISSEKADIKDFILLEDTSRKLRNEDPKIMSKVIDWSVKKVYRIKLPREHFFLVKLIDFNTFSKNYKPSYLSSSLPISSRMFQIHNVSHVLEASSSEAVKENAKIIIEDKSIESELEHLSHSLALTEYGSKTRFFLLNQLEELLCTGLFSNFSINPFGSSVNGFGLDTSDLDMVFDLKTMSKKSSKLNHLNYCPKDQSSSREVSKKMVTSFSDTINWFVPGFMGVKPIPRARVPIIRMYSRVTGLDCDISFQSPHSVDMARIHYSLNKLEPRLRQLVVFGKMWLARISKDFSTMPGYSVSNFMLTTMIISFLQTLEEGPLLPPIKNLGSLSEFPQGSQEISTALLLEKFFTFLANFDYKKYGMNVFDSNHVLKSTHSPLYIRNPCDVEHNICRNINLVELHKFTNAAERAMKAFSQRPDSVSSLLEMCETPEKVTKLTKSQSSRLTSPSVKIKDFWT